MACYQALKRPLPLVALLSQLNGQSFGTPAGHHPFQVISQHMQTDFCADVFKPFRQEVSRSHPHFYCPERMLYRLLQHDSCLWRCVNWPMREFLLIKTKRLAPDQLYFYAKRPQSGLFALCQSSLSIALFSSSYPSVSLFPESIGLVFCSTADQPSKNELN